MVYKSFRLNCIIRIVLLTLSIWLAVFLYINTGFFFTAGIIFFVTAIQVIALIRYIESTNRILSGLFESIRHADFTKSFKVEDLGESFKSIEHALNAVINDFQEIREDRERQNHYLQNIIHHVSVALIAFKNNGDISLINTAAKKLLRVSAISNIKELSNLDPELVTRLLSLKPGEKTRYRCQFPDSALELTIHGTEFRQKNATITLISIQDIQAELEEQEMMSWQNLIRVLTHEIMNSITPISSLSSLIAQMLEETRTSLAEQTADNNINESLADIGDALATIHKRSDGLIDFVETYRNLTSVPKPILSVFKVESLFNRVEVLKKEQLENQSVVFQASVAPKTLELTADENMIEQIIINLIENAIQAMEDRDDKKILLTAKQGKQGRPVIQLADSGVGILDDVIDKIFIPFYTTKPKGSGIGLSLSRQIMRQHGGTIAVHSKADQGAVFTLTF